MGFECDNFPFTFQSGVITSADSLKSFEEALFSALDASSNLFICNIFSQKSISEKEKIELDECFIPSDQTFTRKQLPHICPLLSQSLFDPTISNSAKKLKFIVQYLVYLGLKRVAVRFDPHMTTPLQQGLLKIAKILKGGRIGLIVIVSSGDSKEANEINWKKYIQFRQKIGETINCQLCLETGDNKIAEGLQRWMGQSLVYVSFSQNAFTINQKGYPVLTTPYENFLKKALHSQTHIFITSKNCQKGKLPHFPYFAHILSKVVQNMTEYDIAAQQLIDYLQVPLQPYRDNLDAEIYDIFEKDAHKYEEYEIACREALQGIQENRPIVAYYVGSGKGLILQKFIKAAKKEQKKVKVYCIEKNPYPLQTLKRRIHKNKWTKFVEIVQTDIKTYVMPEEPDIIFSELLGGFGDNELSPECLKWAEKNMTKNTIFIPQVYRSFIRPISAHFLHKQLSPKEKQQYFTVYLDKFYSPFQSQKTWEFKHPLPIDDQLTRQVSLQWQSKQLILVNGFEGSFDCSLFGKAYFSIVPENKDKNFYSWFPLYFSFAEEEFVEKGQKIVIDLSRKSTEKRIWYEWRYSIKDVEGKVRKMSKWHNEKGVLAMELQPQQEE